MSSQNASSFEIRGHCDSGKAFLFRSVRVTVDGIENARSDGAD